MNWTPIGITLQLAIITTAILFVIGVPIAYAISQTKSRWKSAFEALIALPIVLPPTVLGFYLLFLLSPDSAIGSFLERYFDIKLVFSFKGLVVASIFYSLPFMVQPLQSGFSSVPIQLQDAARVLGKNNLTILTRILLPNSLPSIMTGLVLSFAHTIGEFGVVLMIGGSIPGETRVASIAIYEEVEALNYDTAHQYAALLLVLSFAILLFVYTFRNRQSSRLLP
jgi:molybdate transport system permease protein